MGKAGRNGPCLAQLPCLEETCKGTGKMSPQRKKKKRMPAVSSSLPMSHPSLSSFLPVSRTTENKRTEEPTGIERDPMAGWRGEGNGRWG